MDCKDSHIDNELTKSVEDKVLTYNARYYLKRFIEIVAIGFLTITTLAILVGYIVYVTMPGHFSRLILFIFFGILFFVFVLSSIMLLLRRIGILNGLTNYAIATKLQSDFPFLKDYFYTYYDLFKNAQISGLAVAAIRQKAKVLNSVSLKDSSSLKITSSYYKLLFLFVGILTALTLFLYKPVLIGLDAVISFDQNYVYPSPYSIDIVEEQLHVLQGNDFELQFSVEGEMLPNSLYIFVGDSKLLLRKIGVNTYTYPFHQVNIPISFIIGTSKYKSKVYRLNVLYRPKIQRVVNKIVYPKYLGLKDTVLHTLTDLQLPEGTSISYSIGVKNIDSVLLNNSSRGIDFINDTSLNLIMNLRCDTSLYFYFAGINLDLDTNLVLNLKAIKDLKPTIDFEVFPDSIKPDYYNFRGIVSDDYGFSSLHLYYSYDSVGLKSLKSIRLPISAKSNIFEFSYVMDFNFLRELTHEANVYFVVSDNDGVNGFKTTKSAEIPIKILSIEEVRSNMDSISNAVLDESDNILKQINELSDALYKLKEMLSVSELSDWEKTQLLNQFQEKKNSLDRLLEKYNESKQNLSKLNNQISKDKNKSPDKTSFDELLDKELKELLEQFQQLLDKKNLEKLSDFQIDFSDVQKQLSKNRELLNRFKVQEKLQDIKENLSRIANFQKSLSSDSTRTELQSKNLEDIDEFLKDYEQLLQENRQLNQPFKIDDFEKERNSLSDKKEQLESDKQSTEQYRKSKKELDDALQELDKKLNSTVDDLESNAIEMDMEDLKQLLDNLLWYSKRQESLMDYFRNIDSKDPKINLAFKNQGDLIKDFSLINDSLYALGERAPMLQNSIFGVVGVVNKLNISILEAFEERELNLILSAQQRIMMHVNDLALLLEEAENNMQQQMNGGKSGKSKSQPQLGNMRKQQDKIKNELEDMLKQMKEGKLNEQELAKKLSELYGKQEYLQSLLNELLKQGLSNEQREQLNSLNKLLDDINTDLVNKRVRPELLHRQELVLEKMLNLEKSMNKKEEEDEKREASEAQELEYRNKLKYKELRNPQYKLNELQKGELNLKPYFNNFYNSYLREL